MLNTVVSAALGSVALGYSLVVLSGLSGWSQGLLIAGYTLLVGWYVVPLLRGLLEKKLN